jgi:tRNA pseudouridine55 synthase
VSARRGATELSGILAIDKPQGMTSHDVVNRVRRITGERRVGHAGTLDPMATGVLIVLVGPATRLAPYLTSAEKTYDARILFGTETDTDDAEGRITRTARVPDEVCDPFAAAGMVASLVGVHEQVPPAFSAIKRGGVTAYEAARKGEALELEPRTIEVKAARLVGVEIEPPSWDVEFAVSKGTYIRALARDIGRAVESAAHLGTLKRTRSGCIGIADTHTLEELESAPHLPSLFTEPVGALGLPVLAVDDSGASSVGNGRSLDVGIEGIADGAPVAITHDGWLIAVYAAFVGTAKPLAVIPGGVSGGEL